MPADIRPDAATTIRCIEALRESDEGLRSRPEELMLWDWDRPTANPTRAAPAGGTVLLGVAWVDMEFYQDRREAWLGAMHNRSYARIGVALDDITVTHRLLDPVR